MNHPRLSNPQYTLYYKCLDCENEMLLDVSVYIPISQRQRELTSCDKCSSLNIEIIPPKESLGTFMIGDAVRLGRVRTDNGFKEVMQKIHERTAGSRLNDVSNITQI